MDRLSGKGVNRNQPTWNDNTADEGINYFPAKKEAYAMAVFTFLHINYTRTCGLCQLLSPQSLTI